MSSVDWDSLRRRSLAPGGFGQDRLHIWPQLLNAHTTRDTPTLIPTEPHKDESQISLDTARSFVLYPSDNPTHPREQLQAQLHDLIVSVFHAHPKLSYFQGYHDIVSVFMLTLPRQLQFVCVEKLSLHWLRDSMGQGLEPVLGLLRVTKNLIRLADPELASMLEQSSQLPFFALSNLLTLFSHDTPTLPLIQHVFDYLLCRPPIAVVYLAAAIILSRKDQVRRLFDEDEDGMVHSLLSSLPDLVDDEPEIKSSSSPPSTTQPDDTSTSFLDTETTLVQASPSPSPLPSPSLSPRPEEIPLPDSPSPSSDLTLVDHEPDSTTYLKDKIPLSSIPSSPLHSQPSPSPGTTTPSSENPSSPSPSITPPQNPTTTTTTTTTIKVPTLSLPTLLQTATNLSELYPPTHPSLQLSRIMGPQSVIFTWSEDFDTWIGDDEAERMVERPDLVVYPFVDDEEDEEVEGEEEEEEEESSYDEARKRNGPSPHRRRKLTKPNKKSNTTTKNNSKQQQKRKRYHHLHLLRKIKQQLKIGMGKGRKVEKQTILAGVVLLLGIGLAVYNVKRSGAGSAGGGVSGGVGGGGGGGNGGGGWKPGGKHWPSWW